MQLTKTPTLHLASKKKSPAVVPQTNHREAIDEPRNPRLTQGRLAPLRRGIPPASQKPAYCRRQPRKKQAVATVWSVFARKLCMCVPGTSFVQSAIFQKTFAGFVDGC